MHGRIIRLYEDLHKCGLSVRVDFKDLRPTSSFANIAKRGIEKSTHVLVIGSPAYKRQAAVEGSLTSAEQPLIVKKQQSSTSRVLYVLFEGVRTSSIPVIPSTTEKSSELLCTGNENVFSCKLELEYAQLLPSIICTVCQLSDQLSTALKHYDKDMKQLVETDASIISAEKRRTKSAIQQATDYFNAKVMYYRNIIPSKFSALLNGSGTILHGTTEKIILKIRSATDVFSLSDINLHTYHKMNCRTPSHKDDIGNEIFILDNKIWNFLYDVDKISTVVLLTGTVIPTGYLLEFLTFYLINVFF